MKYLESEEFNLYPKKSITAKHKPKILILYGSLRKRSYSKLLALEACGILNHMGAETKIFNPDGLPTFDFDRSVNHPKVKELRNLTIFFTIIWSATTLKLVTTPSSKIFMIDSTIIFILWVLTSIYFAVICWGRSIKKYE